MNRVLEYVITARDKTTSAISSALSKIKGFTATVGKNLQNIRAGFGMLETAAGKLWSVMQKAFAYEKMTYQFKVLIGNIDEARTHMQMLQDLGDTPPFSLEQFAAASREMMKFSDGALGFKDSLELVGDAAAALGRPVEELAQMVGRSYALIRDGQPIQRAGMMLRNVGAITPEVMAKLVSMEKAGATNIQMWQELESALGKFKGAMAETEQTADGMMGAISAQWDDAVRSFGEALLDVSKGGMSDLLETMKFLNESGYIEEWADNAVSAFERVVEGAKAIVKPLGAILGGIWDAIKVQYEVIAQSAGNFVGTLAGGGGLGDAFKAAWEGAKSGVNDVYDLDGAEAESKEQKREERRERRRRRREEREQQAAKMAADKRKKLEEDMAAKQAEKDDAEYAAAWEEYQKQLQKEAEAQRQLDEQLERERIASEERIHQKRMADAREELDEQLKVQDAAEERVRAAQDAVAQAWGWYKDPESLKARIADEEKNIEANKKYRKDYYSLTHGRWSDEFAEAKELQRLGHTDKLEERMAKWRKGSFGLSVEEEATMRVALAENEAQKANRDLARVAENTDILQSIYDEISGEKEEA